MSSSYRIFEFGRMGYAKESELRSEYQIPRRKTSSMKARPFFTQWTDIDHSLIPGYNEALKESTETTRTS
jgi:hypothetical protein